MSLVIALVSLGVLLGVVASVARTIAQDGLGSRMPPRSHVEEVGAWVEQQLRR